MSRLNALRASPFYGIEIGNAARPLDFLHSEWLAENPHYSSEERLGQILCSAVVYGALLDRSAWQSWLNAVDRMQTSDDLAWISYEVECDQSPTGYRTRRWFADPITRRLLERRLQWRTAAPTLNAEQCLLAFLQFTNLHSTVTAAAVDDLEKWATIHWRLRMPPLLIDQALGNCETTALSERSFLRLTLGKDVAEAYSPPDNPERAWRKRPPSDHDAVTDWYDKYTGRHTPEGKAFAHARQMARRSEYSPRQIKKICASWLSKARGLFAKEPARQQILAWCVAQLTFPRPYGPYGYSPYTVEQKLAVLLEGVFAGRYPSTLQDINWYSILSRAKMLVANEQCPTRRRLILSTAVDFVRFMDNSGAWAVRKSKQRVSSTGLGSSGRGRQSTEAVAAEIISDDEYGYCLSHARKMDPSGAFAMIIMLGFRAGLRMDEVAGLETSDFVQSAKHHELHLQRNRYRDLKTPGSRRIIPLDVLLTPRELNSLDQWLAPRRAHARKIKQPILCFGPIGGQIMPSKDYLKGEVEKILETVTGQKLTYHCLRHSFSSYLMLKLLLPDPQSELLIPGSFRNNVTWGHSRILHNRLIGRGSLGQSAMHALSMLMGHTGIPRTLKSYQHLLDMAVWLYCSRSATQIPLSSYIRDHLDEDPDEPRQAPPKLIDPKLLNKALREMKPLHRDLNDHRSLNKNEQFRKRKGNWWNSGSKPWTPEQPSPRPRDSTAWQLVHQLVTLPPNEASTLALQSRISSARLTKWQTSRDFLIGNTQFKTRPQTFYPPRGAIAEQVVETMWRRRWGKLWSQRNLELLREFLDGYRTNDGACRFSSEESAKEFAALLRSLGVPGEHIGIAFGSRTEVRACQHHTDKMALYPEEAPYHYREAKVKPVEHPRADERPALWVSYIKLEEDELGWSFSRQHRLDALNDLRDEETLRSGELLSKRRLAAKAKREARANEIKKLNEGGRAVYQPGTSAYLFGLQMLAIYRGITKDNPAPVIHGKLRKDEAAANGK